jgi:hypothetical protein
MNDDQNNNIRGNFKHIVTFLEFRSILRSRTAGVTVWSNFAWLGVLLNEFFLIEGR